MIIATTTSSKNTRHFLLPLLVLVAFVHSLSLTLSLSPCSLDAFARPLAWWVDCAVKRLAAAVVVVAAAAPAWCSLLCPSDLR